MISKKPNSYRVSRYYTYIIATIFSISIPLIKINGNQIFLLSFDKKQLHLMGVVFDMQELYMMPFLLMLLFLGIFALTAVGGRAWCGWACPQTIFRVIYRDLIQSKLLGLRRIKNKQKDTDYTKIKNQVKQAIAIILWTLLAFTAASNFMWYFIPPADFFSYLYNATEHIVLIGFLLSITIFLVYDVIVLQENFCVYVCPYSRVQSVLYDDDTLQAIYSEKRGGKIYNDNKDKIVFKEKDLKDEQNECTTCQSCVTVCPTHIDIRKGTQLECINCLECVDACTTVMGKLGKESLVQWSSTSSIVNGKKTNIFRIKTLMYIASLFIVIFMLFIMGGTKEYMLLNINKSSSLYKIKQNNIVENNYIFLFQNTQKENYTYDIEIIGKYKDKIKIKGFKAFKLSSGKLRKKVVKLYTNKLLVENMRSNTALTLTIRAFAIQNKEKIFVTRKAVFLYPRSDKLIK